MDSNHDREVRDGDRFAFGANWSRFLEVLDDDKMRGAEDSLRDMLGVDDLEGFRFLDAGSGSGLFSLAARRLGAIVHSFDYDPQSVACTQELRRRYFPEDPDWVVRRGSVLDEAYVAALEEFDVVYSWGVLHHTGEMRKAFSAVKEAVQPGGMLFIAIYNDQGWLSRYWTFVKRLYNRNTVARWFVVAVHAPYLFALRWLVRAISARGAVERGMSLWTDMIDWLGGYPFEVARPEDVFAYFYSFGFELVNLKTCGGRHGCNEFVFKKKRVP